MRLPDFEAWAIFATVAEQGSFTRAAKSWNLSKATVSKAVSRLEAQFGAQLFHRTSRRLTLTETGAALVDRARQILAEAEAAEEAAREEALEPSGMVRIAAPMSFGVNFVAPVIALLLNSHPGIAIDLDLSDRSVDIIGERFDIAVRIGALPDSSLRARTVRAIPRRLVASPEFLARHGVPRHPAELGEVDLICYSLLSTAETWHFTGPGGETAALAASGRLRINNGDAMLPALREGLGVALLPDFIIADDVQAGYLVSILDDWSAPPTALHLVTPPRGYRSKRVDLVLNFLADHL